MALPWVQLYGQALEPEKGLNQYTLVGWSLEDGLPHNSVVGIAQTKEGYLWLATFQGLVRFDGVRFTAYGSSNTPQLLVNSVRGVTVDSRGWLWAGTSGGGVIRYANYEFTVYTVDSGLTDNNVQTVYEDSEQRMWFGTNRGLCYYSMDEGLVNVNLGLNTDDYIVYSLCEYKPGEFWVGTRSGLLRFRQGANGYVREIAPDVGKNVYCMRLDSLGQLWLGSEEGLFMWNGRQLRHFTEADGMPDLQVTTLYFDSKGVLWLGTLTGGLLRHYKGRFDRLQPADGLADSHVAALYQDREGSMWIGTYRGGLQSLKQPKFLNIGTPEGLNNDKIYAVLEDSKGRIWVGTADGGVNIRERDGSWRQITTAQGLSGNYVRTICEAQDGTFWVGTYGEGISRIYPDGRIVQYRAGEGTSGLSDNYVRNIQQMPDGTLWIGTRNGLNRLHDGVWRTYTLEDGLPANSVIDMVQDKAGRLWLGTEGGGLAYFYKGVFSRVTAEDGLSGEVILSLLYNEEQDLLWVGTTNGLDLLQGGEHLSSFTVKEGEMAATVHMLLEDDAGYLWMGSSDGIYKLKKELLLAYAKGARDNWGDVQFYSMQDGMRSPSTQPGGNPAGTRSQDGRLWFPTSGGVAVIDPLNIPTNTLPPGMRIERIVAEQQTYLAANGFIELSPEQDNIAIHFTALSFVAPSNVRIRYRLNGVDDDWRAATEQRVAFYTNLSPGTYTFEMQASNNDGVWVDQPLAYRFALLSPWYRTPWAIGLYIVGLGGLIYVLFLWNSARLQRENEQLEGQVKLRTQQLERQKTELENANEEITAKNESLARTKQEVELAYRELERNAQGVQDSIVYARRIQEAILPNLASMQAALPKSFVLYFPRDIVSGDFYWFARRRELIYLAVIDCTGHGVPGAFMSVMANALLNQLVNERKLTQPADILNQLNTAVVGNLHQYDPDSDSLDGMDISLVVIEPKAMQLRFAGANQTLYSYDKLGAFSQIRGDRQSIGGGQYRTMEFTQHEVDIELGDTFYLFSDGVPDQFGGPRNRKLTYQNLQLILQQLQQMSMSQQQHELAHYLEVWRGNHKQLDDMVLIGFRF